MQREDVIFSVSELNEYVGLLLSQDPMLSEVRVRGEISGFKRHSSGHLYFSLKESGAVVRCVMFRQYAQQLGFRPEDGQQVCISGSAALYARDGSFQLYVRDMESLGEGALYLRFLALKASLEAEGLFDATRKQPIPYLPRAVGIVTSGTGAALQDILQIVNRRFPGMGLVLCPVRVQGEGAAAEIAAGIERMNEENAADVLIVGRGGGSIEDLWAFNEPQVARAIFNSKIPVISAVGHETDFTIADFVADLRAPTPSAAAELAVPELAALSGTLSDTAARLDGVLERGLQRRRERLEALGRSHEFLQLPMRLANERRQLDILAEYMDRACADRIADGKRRLSEAKTGLEALSPAGVLKRGFVMVQDDAGAVVTAADKLQQGDRVSLRFYDGTAAAEILHIERTDTDAKN